MKVIQGLEAIWCSAVIFFIYFFPTSLLIYSSWSGHKTLRHESSAINLWPYLILSPGLGKWNGFISKSVTYTSNASLYPAEAKVSPSHHSYIYATSPEGQWCERRAAGYGDEMSLCGLNFLTSCSTFLRCTSSLSCGEDCRASLAYTPAPPDLKCTVTKGALCKNVNPFTCVNQFVLPMCEQVVM